MRVVRLLLVAGVLASLEAAAVAGPLRLVCHDGDGQALLRRFGPIDWVTCDDATDGACVFTIERAGCACAPKGCCGTDEYTVPVGRRQRVPAAAGRARLVLRCVRGVGTSATTTSTTPASPTTTSTTVSGASCQSDADCIDANPCTGDACRDGTCVHECLCVSPGADGGVTCCPGPAAECPPPPPPPSTTTTLPPTCDPGVCRYYFTCGYPVCDGSFDGTIPGVEPCTSETEGAPCGTWSQTCDPGVGCGVRLLCTDHDPAVVCPISRRDAKRDVSYLEDADLDRMLAEIRRVRLATYRYKGEPDLGTSHLGFIIDDLGASPAVAPDGAHVDLYGYASMAVAAIQAQQRRIEALEREVAALQNERAPRH